MSVTSQRQRRFSSGHDSSAVIVMMPLIQEPHYHCVTKQTLVPQVIAAKLWNGLGTMQPIFHQRCVALLHQLHSISPIPRAIERILARSLGYGPMQAAQNDFTVDAFQRFTLLWHLSRNLEANKGGSSGGRTFDVCLLKMMDNLNLSSGPLKALSQSWLVHAMARGDIARLMEPLFLTLLDPSTARVSVLHAKIEHLESVDDGDGSSHRVYAIATSNNEVVYHVSSGKKGSDKVKRIFAFSKFQQSKKSGSSNAVLDDDGIGKSISHSASDSRLTSVNLMVNPFALVPPEVEEYDNFTRGYGSATVSTASSVDEDSSSAGDDDDSKTTTTGLSISKLFGEDDEEVKDGPSKEVAVTSTGPASLDSMAPQGRTSSSSSSANPNPVSVHPLHSHLL